jgi:hypothetical protein
MAWDELIAGAIIGGVIGFSIDKLLKLLSNLIEVKRSYVGEYYSYRFSTSDDENIVAHKWRVYRKFNGLIGVEIQELDHDNPFIYKGLLRVSERYIYVHIIGTSHSEEMFYIFPEPIDKTIKAIKGLLLAVSMKNKPWSGDEILCSEKISNRKAKSMLSKMSED